MSDIKNQDKILDAIDQLRRRKARPDIERICNFLLRRFSVSSRDTISDLEKLVQAEVVVKVEYKGNTSYRNAAKWSRFAIYNKNKEETVCSELAGSLLSNAVAELIIQEPDYLDIGIPGIELEKFVLQRENSFPTKQKFEAILHRELNNGNLVKLENGNYSLADHPVPVTSPGQSTEQREETTEPELANMTNTVDSINKAHATNDSVDVATSIAGSRVGVRRKRAKKVFDPSDNNLPTRKRGRPLGSRNRDLQPWEREREWARERERENPHPGCYMCHRVSRGNYEKLVPCKECPNRVHASCEGRIVSPGDWLCSQCSQHKLVRLSPAVPSPPPEEHKDPLLAAACDDDAAAAKDCMVPDVQCWTADQVHDYLCEQRLPDLAAILLEHEIDGTSLLLLKRSDVLAGLELKLGPALKLYRQVKKLQLRRDDPQLLWA